MRSFHNTDIIFMEQPVEVQQKTLKFHRDFYNSVGPYKDEPSLRFCKCTNIQNKISRADLYLHSLEANHYPLVSCAICGVLMEREDAAEHAAATCDPSAEGGIFLEAMKKKMPENKAASVVADPLHNMSNPLLIPSELAKKLEKDLPNY